MANNKMIGVIIVVAIIVVAAVAVVLVNNNNGKSEGYNIESSLSVFGNANGDYKIDNDDKSIIQDIIDGKKDLKDYPLADAWTDGVVDQKDLTQVQAIIDKTATEVWHINMIGDKQTAESTKWPLKNVLASGTSNVLLYFKMLGLEKNIKGESYGSTNPPDMYLYPYAATLENLGGSTTMTYDAAATTITKYNCTALVTSTNASYIKNYADFEKQNIDVVRIDATGTKITDFVGAVLFLAFMFDVTTNTYEICQFCEDLMGDVNSKLANAKKVYATSSNTNGTLTSYSSDYTKVILAAGAEFPDSEQYKNAGSVKPASASWIYDVQIDYIVCLRTGAGVGGSWYGGTLEEATVQKNAMDPFSNFQAYKAGHVYAICGELPTPLRIAYAAEVMHPECFPAGYADQWHQKFCDEIFGAGSYDISKLKFVFQCTTSS